MRFSRLLARPSRPSPEVLTVFRIIVHPTFDRRGNRLHGRFFAIVDGRQFCVSREPLLATARILLGRRSRSVRHDRDAACRRCP
jgi:hypothetical protein